MHSASAAPISPINDPVPRRGMADVRSESRWQGDFRPHLVNVWLATYAVWAVGNEHLAHRSRSMGVVVHAAGAGTRRLFFKVICSG